MTRLKNSPRKSGRATVSAESPPNRIIPNADGLGAAVLAALINAGRYDAGGNDCRAGVGLCVELYGADLRLDRYGQFRGDPVHHVAGGFAAVPIFQRYAEE